MKKQIISIIALLMLSACANTEDTTVCKIMHWCYTPQPKYQQVNIDPQTTPCCNQDRTAPCCNNAY